MTSSDNTPAGSLTDLAALTFMPPDEKKSSLNDLRSFPNVIISWTCNPSGHINYLFDDVTELRCKYPDCRTLWHRAGSQKVDYNIWKKTRYPTGGSEGYEAALEWTREVYFAPNTNKGLKGTRSKKTQATFVRRKDHTNDMGCCEVSATVYRELVGVLDETTYRFVFESPKDEIPTSVDITVKYKRLYDRYPVPEPIRYTAERFISLDKYKILVMMRIWRDEHQGTVEVERGEKWE